MKSVTVPNYINMMLSDKELKEVEILRTKQVTDNLIELKRQHEEHFFSTCKRLLDAYLESSLKHGVFNKEKI